MPGTRIAVGAAAPSVGTDMICPPFAELAQSSVLPTPVKAVWPIFVDGMNCVSTPVRATLARPMPYPVLAQYTNDPSDQRPLAAWSSVTPSHVLRGWWLLDRDSETEKRAIVLERASATKSAPSTTEMACGVSQPPVGTLVMGPEPSTGAR